ncbi:hypothetical protein A0256_00080 [Mucilaginibacter sp. PAMC 26640]|nr:hypothetical protein A0256_00080 [Mucilaginibacter sp. PAMC 26640]
MHTDNDQFYADLPVHRVPMGNLLVSPKRFREIPANWHVIITDIKNSTQAVFGGGHENVNLIATGSIVSVLNIAFGMQVTVPFFFGGDGATCIVPPSIHKKVMQALRLYKVNTLENFNLELRTGTIPVADIYAKGHHLHIAKYSSGEIFSIPVILGNGLNYAEQVIKGDDYMFAANGADDDDQELDLTGMQCRWDRISPPDDKEEVVSLLVIATNGAMQSEAFKVVMDTIDKVYGLPQKRQPISVDKLKFRTSFNNLGLEMRASLGKIKWLQLVKNWAINLYGKIYFNTESGQRYLKSLVENSDTLVIDGKINTVISGTAKKREKLLKVLDQLEHTGKIVYGLHISNASVMSCYVRDLKDDHIHFVDGSEGGYTQAAKMLKAKLKGLATSSKT